MKKDEIATSAERFHRDADKLHRAREELHRTGWQQQLEELKKKHVKTVAPKEFDLESFLERQHQHVMKQRATLAKAKTANEEILPGEFTPKLNTLLKLMLQ